MCSSHRGLSTEKMPPSWLWSVFCHSNTESKQGKFCGKIGRGDKRITPETWGSATLEYAEQQQQHERPVSTRWKERSDSPKLSFVLHSHIMARGPISLISKLINKNKNKVKRSTFLLVSWPQLNKYLYVHLMIILIKQINTSQSCLLALICSNNTCEKCWTSFYTPQISVMIIKRTTHLFK